MGRPKGDAARSKSRPSSSTLAATLLPGSGTLNAGFGGYVGSTRIDTGATAEDAYLNVDGESAANLRRLSKKDPTTKLKALAALTTFFQEHSVAELSSIVPCWVFEYKKLVQDNSRQVREATHKAMGSLVSTIGRSLAPHLRSLMGAWWVAQFDPFYEVSEAARQAFQVAFPGHKKRLEALVFCANDIFIYLDENLKLTPQTISDRNTPIEESTEKHERVMSSSLLALAALLDVLFTSIKPSSSKLGSPPTDNSETDLQNENVKKVVSIASAANKLFQDHKLFQAFFKASSSRIRSAVYQAMKVYIQHVPEVITVENMDAAVKSVLGAFLEKDPTCHQAMWDMVLLFSRAFPQAWEGTATRKVVYPRFWAFLRHGCYGSRQVSYPCLLPFLSLIPASAVAPPEGFFVEFFTSLWRGCEGRTWSYEEGVLLLRVMKECLLWVTANAERYTSAEGAEMQSLRTSIIETVLLRLLWRSYVGIDLEEQIPALQHKSSLFRSEQFIEDIGNYIVDILRSFDDQLLSTCWLLLREECSKILRGGEDQNNGVAVARMSHFFLLLDTRIPSSSKEKKEHILISFVKPFIAEAFPLIRELEQPEAVKLLCQLVSSYGPYAFVSLATLSWKGDSDKEIEGELTVTHDVNNIFTFKHLQHLFRTELLPWCLKGQVNELKLELLIAFLESEIFSKEWNSVLTHISEIEEPMETCQGSKQLNILAALIQKLQERCILHQGNDTFHVLERWRSSKIDETVLALACRGRLFEPSCYILMRSALRGVPIQGSYWFILSHEAMLKVLEELLKAMISAAVLSNNNSTMLLLASVAPWISKEAVSAESRPFESAKSAIDILVSCYSSLRFLDRSTETLTKIFATIVCLYWAYVQPVTPENQNGDHDDESEGNITSAVNMVDIANTEGREGEAAFVGSLIMAHQDIFSVCKDLNPVNRQNMQEILIGGIRKAIFEVPDPDIHKAAAWWVLDLLKSTCLKTEEMQETLDLLLTEDGCRPIWSEAPTGSDETKARSTTQVERHSKFSSVIHRIGLSLGHEVMFLGSLVPKQSSLFEVYQRDEEICTTFSRPWLVVELLCTWEWPGGSAETFILPFLQFCVGSETGSPYWVLVDHVLDALFRGASSRTNAANHQLYSCWRRKLNRLDEPYLRSLLSSLTALFGQDGPLGKRESERMFNEYLFTSGSASPALPLCIVPCILDLLMPALRKKNSTEGLFPGIDLESAICDWLKFALNVPPLSVSDPKDADTIQWMQVAIACFPVDSSGGATALLAASGADISQRERNFLLFLLRKEYSSTPSERGTTTSEQLVELILARLVVAAVCYCWQNFGVEEWTFVLGQLRKWLEDGVVNAEDFTEAVAEMISEGRIAEKAVKNDDDISIELLGTAVNILSLIKALNTLDEAMDSDSSKSLAEAQWESSEARATENVLRLMLATGLAESLGTASNTTREEISLHRVGQSYLWDQVANIVLSAPDRVRESAVRAADLWGLGKSAVSALYSMLFSPHPLASLQWVSYKFLSTDPLQHQAVTWKPVGPGAAEDDDSDLNLQKDTISADIRPELLSVLNMPSLLLDSPPPSTCQVHYFLAWSLFLSHLQSLGTLSPARDRLLQYTQDSDTLRTLLDCLFQHIALKKNVGTSSRKKEVIESLVVAEAAKRTAGTGSITFAVEGLWGGGTKELAILAGALYGLLLRVLPASVRVWFTGLRDKATASAIEAFTTAYCSPQLLSDEFAQVQAAAIADESLSIRANRMLREVTAIYKKEEAGMDIVIKLPHCYPLRAVEVDCTRRLGISETRLRKWILSMAAFLRNQNGAVSEAVLIWKRNVDREFEGVEECPICYSIIHTSNHSLPRLACKTCKHKFHAACLYKWFSSSHKSTCPLCQTPF